jgi:peptidylamidoglycolate lyase
VIERLAVNDTLIRGSDIMVLDSAFHVLARFGRSGLYSGIISRYHDITVDNEGSLYVGDILNNTIQKFSQISGK